MMPSRRSVASILFGNLREAFAPPKSLTQSQTKSARQRVPDNHGIGQAAPTMHDRSLLTTGYHTHLFVRVKRALERISINW
jgi:hypothetical protein